MATRCAAAAESMAAVDSKRRLTDDRIPARSMKSVQSTHLVQPARHDNMHMSLALQVVFLHPKDNDGVLMELEEVGSK